MTMDVDRELVHARLLELARADERIVAAAVVGSLAHTNGDPWSDIDLTFGLAEGTPLAAVLDEWATLLSVEFNATALFDVQSGPSRYRVLLLPSCLQVDISVTPESQFGAVGPSWRLLFGKAVARPQPVPPPADELLGLAIHHLLRARICTERGKLWQAAYWLDSARNTTLSLACVQRGLPHAYGRGLDQLPPELLAAFRPTFVAAPVADELLRALAAAITALRQVAAGMPMLAEVQDQLERLLTPLGTLV